MAKYSRFLGFRGKMFAFFRFSWQFFYENCLDCMVNNRQALVNKGFGKIFAFFRFSWQNRFIFLNRLFFQKISTFFLTCDVISLVIMYKKNSGGRSCIKNIRVF